MEARGKFIVNVLFFAIVALFFYFGFRYLFPLFLPLIMGFLVAFLAARPARWLARKCGWKQSLLQILITLLIYGAVIALLWFLGARILLGISGLFEALPEFYESTVAPQIDKLNQFMGEMTSGEGSLAQFWETAGGSLDTLVQGVSQKAVEIVTALATGLPTLFLGVSVAAISGLFFAADYENIVHFFAQQTPTRAAKVLYLIKDCIQTSVGKMLKSYAILMAVTFCELWAGFWLLRLDNAFALAFLISFVDLLPILGTGAVMIPWFLFLLLTGNTTLGVSLALLYGVITVVRSILEPKILGDQTGLHPLLALACVYAGGLLFGFWGIFLLPIAAMVVLYLLSCGVLKWPGGPPEQKRKKRPGKEKS